MDPIDVYYYPIKKRRVRTGMSSPHELIINLRTFRKYQERMVIFSEIKKTARAKVCGIVIREFMVTTLE